MLHTIIHLQFIIIPFSFQFRNGWRTALFSLQSSGGNFNWNWRIRLCERSGIHFLKSFQKFHVPFLSKKENFDFFCTFSFLTYLDRISLSVEEYSVSLIENDSHYISRYSREISESLGFECLDVPICIVCNEHRTLKWNKLSFMLCSPKLFPEYESNHSMNYLSQRSSQWDWYLSAEYLSLSLLSSFNQRVLSYVQRSLSPFFLISHL